jgi:predicted HTH transcriptional regulator
LYRSVIKDNYFTRKDYLKNYREISAATASRDLKYAVEEGLIKKLGDKDTKIYRCIVFVKHVNINNIGVCLI